MTGVELSASHSERDGILTLAAFLWDFFHFLNPSCKLDASPGLELSTTRASALRLVEGESDSMTSSISKRTLAPPAIFVGNGAWIQCMDLPSDLTWIWVWLLSSLS